MRALCGHVGLARERPRFPEMTHLVIFDGALLEEIGLQLGGSQLAI